MNGDNALASTWNRGQVMLLTALLLSGTAIGVTAIAGVLTLYQLRQSSNASDSARALYAADAGIEWELYRHSKNDQYVKPVLSNGAEFETKVTVGGGIKSTGYANGLRKVARAFEVAF